MYWIALMSYKMLLISTSRKTFRIYRRSETIQKMSTFFIAIQRLFSFFKLASCWGTDLWKIPPSSAVDGMIKQETLQKCL